MKCGIVLDRLFARHMTPVGHPERPERILKIVEELEQKSELESVIHISPAPAQEKWISAVHTLQHFQKVKDSAKQAFYQFDPDTYASPESFEVALQAVGSTVKLVKKLTGGEIDAGLALVRPPGHHAESNRIMGFCLFNNIAIAAHWAVSEGGLQRVAVVDFDVHHGNGTQEIFYSRQDVMYLSAHQFPFYPGTGHFSELGQNEGKGFTVNFPIRAGIGNYFYCSLFEDFVIPVIRQFEPQLVLVSAGYDAHQNDPLAGMNLDEDGFGELVNQLNQVAVEVCDGRIGYILEGGYNLEALGKSVLRTLTTTLEPQNFHIEKVQEEEYKTYREHMVRVFSEYWEL